MLPTSELIETLVVMESNILIINLFMTMNLLGGRMGWMVITKKSFVIELLLNNFYNFVVCAKHDFDFQLV